MDSEDPERSSEVTDENTNNTVYTRRCKVRILGYHTISDENGYVLKDIDLPWAHIMVGPGLATQDGNGSLHEYKGGENVLGFFLDGDEAQQPVIIGGFGRGKQVDDDNTKKSGTDCRIRPFTPNLSTTLKSNQKRLIRKSTDNQGNETGSKAKYVTTGDSGTIDENASSVSQEKSGSIKKVSPSFKDIPIRSIETALQNIVYVLEQVQAYQQFYVSLGQDLISTLSKKIGAYVKQISGCVRKILEKIKSVLLKGLGDAFNAAIKALPETIKSIVGVSFKQAVESIICIFERITGSGIFSAVFDLVESLLNGDFVDALLCEAEALLSRILSQFLNPIINEIQGTLALLSNILGNISNVVGDAIGKALEIFNFILSFFECAPENFRGERTWTIAGPSSETFDNIKNVINKLDIPELNLGETESLICDSNILWYLPPIIEILGNGGAIGLPVVRNGKLIGVYVDEPGRGYSKPQPPIVTVRKNTVLQNAGGAEVKAKVNDDGQIENFIVVSQGSGYVSSPSFQKAKISGVEITSEDLNLPQSQLTVEKQSAIQSLDINLKRTQDSDTIEVLPFLNGFEVISPGIDYSEDDEILLNGNSSSFYGLEISKNLSPTGSFVEINITRDNNNQPTTFEVPPEITFNTEFGSGAQVIPIMDFVKVETIEKLNDGSVIAETTSGKQLKVDSDKITKISNCPFK